MSSEQRKTLEYVIDRLEAWADMARIRVMNLPDSEAEKYRNELANYGDLAHRLRSCLPA